MSSCSGFVLDLAFVQCEYPSVKSIFHLVLAADFELF